ncbi:GerAB/ArcD/ProY family transporter [Desulfotomaculum copahuensis]|uniref:GerAB/ArcD/ProY family transporter n=1 Tax=Desulfotomaculum copahuensis TaxID=1838280 RepID=UPI000B0BDD23|nr:endospore germination permease [Desulfotomaculum copahuensis]
MQAIFLLIGTVAATAIVFLPGLTAATTGRDSWLTALLAAIPGLYVAFLVSALGRLFPGQTLVQYLEQILGGPAGKAAGLYYLFFFLQTNAIIVRELGELIATAIMPRTPQVVFAILMVAVCAYGVSQGLEVIARVMELTYPLILALFGLMLILVSGHMQFSRLLPVLEHGIRPVLLASLDPFAWRGEIIVLAMFLPYLARPARGRRNAIIAVLLTSLLLVLDALASTTVFGVTTARLNYPTFELVRLAGIGQFLTRLDAVWIVIWLFGMFGKVGIFLYATVMAATHLFKLREARPLIAPLSILTIALSLSQFANNPQMIAFLTGPFVAYSFSVEWFIPTILLLTARLRGISTPKK